MRIQCTAALATGGHEPVRMVRAEDKCGCGAPFTLSRTMLRRTLVVACIACFLGSIAFVSCRPPSDPNQTDEDTSTEPSDTGTTDGGGGTMDGTGGDSGGSTGDDTTVTDVGPDGGGSGCERGGGESPHAGGTPTSDPIQNDAGLQQVLDKIKSIKSDNGGSWPTDSEDNPKTVTLEESEQIEVSNAVVTATSYKSENVDRGQQNFWVEDSQTPMTVYLDMGEEIDCPIVRVGDRVSFTVTAVKNFNGIPQISVVKNYRRNEDANSDAVPVLQKTGETISAEEFGQIVRVSGQITAEQGSCGGDAICFDLEHGGQTITYRATGPVKPAVGDCVTYVGPVNSFPGPLADGDKTPQLQPTNLDWAFTETPQGADAGTGTCEAADFFNGQIFTPENRN